jgi:hypothetical protein
VVQSEYNAQPASPLQTLRKHKNQLDGQKQVETFMQLNQIAGPPESVQSLPITTFEDT